MSGRPLARLRRDSRGRELFEVALPVAAGAYKYFLVVDRDSGAYHQGIDAVRRSMLLVVPGLALVLGLTWLLGGSTLTRRHRAALERATLDPLTELGNHRAFKDELARADELGWLAAMAAEHGVDPTRIVIEVTERGVTRPLALVHSCERLRAMGFRLALDDVGAGNSGLEMLRGYAFDYVKVDRGVVAAAAQDAGARGVLSAVGAFARETEAFVIAEGVEDGATCEFLRRLDRPARSRGRAIEGGQGYGLGRPQPSVAEALALPAPHFGSEAGSGSSAPRVQRDGEHEQRHPGDAVLDPPHLAAVQTVLDCRSRDVNTVAAGEHRLPAGNTMRS